MVTSTGAIAGEWVMLSVALLLVAARIYVRLYINRDRIYWSDIWLIMATLCAIGLLISDTWAYKAGAMYEFEHPSVDILKVRFAVNYLFDTGMYFPKFSIIAFYYALVPHTRPRMRKVLYFITAFTVASCLVTFFDVTFWCGTKVSSNWSTEPNACNAYNSPIMMQIHWPLNFITEVMNVVYPFPLVRDIKLPRRREKIGLGFILGLGVFTICVSIGRFNNMMSKGNGTFSNYLWATAEMCVSIIVVALTALRPLLRKIAIGYKNYRSGYNGTSDDARSKTGRSRATPNQSQISGAYWRGVTGTKSRDGAQDGTGSEVELNDIKSGGVLKTEEIRISSETYFPEEAGNYPSRPERAFGIETRIA